MCSDKPASFKSVKHLETVGFEPIAASQSLHDGIFIIFTTQVGQKLDWNATKYVDSYGLVLATSVISL